MVLHCVVPECKNSSGTPGISFHRFPLDEMKRKAWFLRMRHRFKVTPAMRVCSAHFLPKDYRYISTYRKCLKEGAEPSVFPYDTSVKTGASLEYLWSMQQSKKQNEEVWEPQGNIDIPPLEDFLEVPLEYIRRKRQANKLFHLRDKSTILPFKVKKNVQESSSYASCNENKTSKISSVDFKPYSVYDSKTWKWLKRTKKTRKAFTSYFASGMSPAVAIQHHENLLCFENPDLLSDSKRNPPRAWVYSLYDSWLKEKEENAFVVSKSEKPGFADDEYKCEAFTMEPNALIVTSTMNEADSIVNQKDPQAPCIIHMNNKLADDFEDLKHLLIPNEVKELFCKYFDDGLDVSSAMKLNEENLKRNKNWPQFTPSERVVNYIYKLWHHQIKSCDDSSKDSGFISFDEKNYLEYSSSFGGLNEQAEYSITDNFITTSEITSNSESKETVKDLSETEVNNLSETTMEILSFPFIPPNSSSNSSVFVKADNVASEIAKEPLKTDKLLEKKPVLPKVDCALLSVQEQFNNINSQNSTVSQISSVPISTDSFSIKSDLSSNPISAVSVNPPQSSFSVTSSFSYNQLSAVSVDSLQNSFSITSDLSNNQISAVSVNSPQNSFANTSDLDNNSISVSACSLQNSFTSPSDFGNNQISAASVSSVQNSAASFYEENYEVSKSNKFSYSDFSSKYSHQTLSESSNFTCQTTFSNSFNELKVANYSQPPITKDSNIFHSSTMYDSHICFGMNSENEHANFFTFQDKSSECASRMACETKELNNIYSTPQINNRINTYSTSQLDKKINTYTPSSSTFINGYTIVKKMPHKSKMDDFTESVEPNFAQTNMGMSSYVKSADDEMSMSFTDDEEEYLEMNGTFNGNFKIASLEFSKQNEDQKFLMSLLPEFECIPDGFKVILKNEILNLVHSTKLRANRWRINEN